MAITTQDFDNAERDLKTVSATSNSRDPDTLAPIQNYNTRLGDQVDTLAGRLAKLGYLPPIDYASGIVFTANDNTKTIEREGFIYAPLPSELPFTTGGNWASDSAGFFVVQNSVTAGAQFADVASLKAGTALGSSTPVSFANYLGQKVSVSSSVQENYIITDVNPQNLSFLANGVWSGENHELTGGFYAKRIYENKTSSPQSPSPQQFNTFHDMGVGSLRKIGRVLAPDITKGWMNTRVESPSIMWDERDGLYHMVFTGYGTGTGQEQASVGHATSNNLVDWSVDNLPLIDGTQVNGDPDEYGGTGPYLMKHEGTYYLFYIGLTEAGYEGGIKTLCLATRDSWSDSWTRRGIVIGIGSSSGDSAWRDFAIWHPTINKRGDTWYLFFNASGQASGASDSQGVERIGYATSTDLLNWIVDDVNSPLITTENNTWKSKIAGDPSVYRVGDFWFMNYFGFAGSTSSSDSIAWTTDAEFPLNWREYNLPYLNPSSSGTLDNLYAHKPFVLFVGGKKYHYYTAVNSSNYRTIALAVSDTNVSNRHYADKNIVHERTTPSNSFSLDRFQSDEEDLAFDVVHDTRKSEYKIERANQNGINGMPLLVFEQEASVLASSRDVFLKINNRFDSISSLDFFIDANEYAYQLIFSSQNNSLSVRRSSITAPSPGAQITWDSQSEIWRGGNDGGFSFDSGWQPVATNSTYTFIHNLGKTPTDVRIQFSDSAQGVGIVYEGWGFVNNGWRFIATDDDETFANAGSVKVRTGQFLTAGNGTKAAATHIRVLAR